MKLIQRLQSNDLKTITIGPWNKILHDAFNIPFVIDVIKNSNFKPLQKFTAILIQEVAHLHDIPSNKKLSIDLL